MFLGAECDVVDHHEVKEGVDELRSVGTMFVNGLLGVSLKDQRALTWRKTSFHCLAYQVEAKQEPAND